MEGGFTRIAGIPLTRRWLIPRELRKMLIAPGVADLFCVFLCTRLCIGRSIILYR